MHTTTEAFGRAMTAPFPEPDFAVQLREELGLADVRYVLDLFVVDLQSLTEAVRQAAAEGQPQSMSRSLHALAGAAGSVGASDLERVCRTGMAAIKAGATDLAGHLDGIEQAAVAAGLALARVRAELDA
jgi:HPt (histidine-containing phosphotransfer) domain-containing protein